MSMKLLLWHVISRSDVVISITNCYIRLTYLLTYNEVKEKSYGLLCIDPPTYGINQKLSAALMY